MRPLLPLMLLAVACTGTLSSELEGPPQGPIPAAPAQAAQPAANAMGAINRLVDDWHHAAAAADESKYFGYVAPEFVFLGTDATERWDLAGFRAFAHPYFAAGKAWTFVPRDRHVVIAGDGNTAWFDELLDSASYGVCRGSGVLRNVGGEWKIAQYNLSIPIPNALAKKFVEEIRGASPLAAPPTPPPSH
jgi:ketosteroid isomerase-like protein